MTDSTPQRASDIDQPDGGDGSTGRTPHPTDPAEGSDEAAGTSPADPAVEENARTGVDPENRVTGG